MNRLLPATLLFAVCANAQDQIPSQYQAIYSLVSSQLTLFDTQLKAGWNGAPHPYISSPQLMSASSDQYTNLINANYYSEQVEPELLSLQALGCRGVTIHVDLPILYQPFYSSNPALYQQFVSFYQQVVQDVHSRNMKLIVETGVGSALSGNLVNDYQAFYASLSWTEYMTARSTTAVNIAQLIRPDYLTVITEPDSEAVNSYQSSAGTLSGSTQLLQSIMAALQAARVTGVSIGAGTGSWQNSYTQFAQSFLAQPINFLDIHIYPVNRNFLQNAATGAQMAHAAGKEVGMSECWDWKIADDELGVLTYATIESRSPFSFWAPDDQQFLATLDDLAQADKFAFISPFWSHYLNAYLDFSTYGNLSPSDILNDSYQASGTAVAAGQYTSTGTNLQAIVLPAPDTNPPSIPAEPTLTQANVNSVVIGWTPATDNVGVAGYHLIRDGKHLTDVNAWTYRDTGLTSGVTYKYALEAFDAAGNKSAVSPQLSVTTIDTTPPTAPANLQVTGVTPASVSLSWSPSYNIDGVAGYRVLRGTSSTSLAYHATGIPGTTYTDSGVRPNTTYYYQVVGYLASGLTGLPSAIVSATTPN